MFLSEVVAEVCSWWNILLFWGVSLTNSLVLQWEKEGGAYFWEKEGVFLSFQIFLDGL